MKSLMTNSTQPNIFVAKIRDQMYLKHLREVEKINNREALGLIESLKEYNQIYGSYEKSKRQSKQFESNQHSTEILRKNDLINKKIKHIRSMFSAQKFTKKSQSLFLDNEAKDHKIVPLTSRYQQNNQEKLSLDLITHQISNELNNSQQLSKPSDGKANRVSLHYYLRKRQQELIEHENEKLKKGILSQKSAYSSSSKKNNFTLKLPSVKSARHSFNQVPSQSQNITSEGKINEKHQ